MELQGHPSVASLDPLDPRRVRCALQHDDHLPARIFVDEHRRYIRCGSRPDQRACPTFLLFSSSFVSSRDVLLLQALAPTLIIVRAGLKSSAGSNSSFAPAKGSINNPYYPSPPPRPSIRDIESGSAEEDDPVVVHIRKATEIRLGDMSPVSVALIIPPCVYKSCFFSIEQHWGVRIQEELQCNDAQVNIAIHIRPMNLSLHYVFSSSSLIIYYLQPGFLACILVLARLRGT